MILAAKLPDFSKGFTLPLALERRLFRCHCSVGISEGQPDVGIKKLGNIR